MISVIYIRFSVSDSQFNGKSRMLAR